MDFSITDIDIYTLNKDNALRLARDYKLKIPSDPQSITVSELRQKLSLSKEIYKKAKRDVVFQEILSNVLQGNTLSDQDAKDYPQLLEFQTLIENTYETVYEEYEPPVVTQTSNTASNIPNYENSQIDLHEKLLSNRKHFNLNDKQTSNEDPTKETDVKTNIELSNFRGLPSSTKPNQVNMSNSNIENIPLIKPSVFSGQQHENVSEFLKKYELAARCNRWSDRTKLDLFGTYTSGIAYKWYSDFMDLEPSTTWDNLKTNFKKSFGQTGFLFDIQTTLDNRIQHENETPLQFYFEIRNLCRQINPSMDDEQIINYTIKGLRPNYFDEIVRMDSSNLTDFQEKLSKLQSIQALKQQNTRKYNMHYGFDYAQSINAVVSNTNQEQILKPKSVHFNPTATYQQSKSPELLNAITELTKAVSELKLNKSKIDSDPSPKPQDNKYVHKRYSSRSPKRYDSHTYSRQRSPSPGQYYKRKQHYYNRNSSTNSYSHHDRRYNCDICKRDNHFTKNCYFNKKNPLATSHSSRFSTHSYDTQTSKPKTHRPNSKN